MAITTMSSRDFNRDTGRAKIAAQRGPVFITDRGAPAHVLLTFEDYQRLTGSQATIIDLISLPPGAVEVEFEPAHPRELARPADLT